MIWWKIFFSAGGSAHWKSFKEILIVLVVATSPLYLGALLHYMAAEVATGYLSSLTVVIQRGELFLYCMSVVSTIVWLANKEWFSEFLPYPARSTNTARGQAGGIVEKKEESPSHPLHAPKWLFNLFSVVAFGVCLMFFGIDFVKARIDPHSLIVLSSSMYAAAIVLWYVINVLSSADPPNLERDFKKGAKDLAERLRNLRAGHGT